MISNDPEIAGERGGRLWEFRHGIFVRESFRGILGREQSRQFFVFEANDV